MKKIVPALILFTYLRLACANPADPVSEAKALFLRQEYNKGLSLLNDSLRYSTVSALQRTLILKALAEFYESLVGDTERAMVYYSEILSVNLPNDHPLKSFAHQEISRFKTLEAKYIRENKLLEKLQYEPERDKIKEQISQLQEIIKDNPEYYRLSEVYYYLGDRYLKLNEYRMACKWLKNAMELKPAINYYLPVQSYYDVAHEDWLRSVINKVSWALIVVLLVVSVSVFYASRPWQWVRPSHLAICLVVLFLWWAVFNIAHRSFGGEFKATEKLIGEMGLTRPAFLNAAPASPGSDDVTYLFWYGIAGVVGSFVFSIGTSKFRNRTMALLVNLLFGLLLFVALVGVFYMRYCDTNGRFYSQAKNKLYYLKGNIYFNLRDYEPYILTNPKAYPNLDLTQIPDSDLREWIKQYCPFDKVGQKVK